MTPTQIQNAASGFNPANWLESCEAFVTAHPEALAPSTIGHQNPTPDNIPPYAWRLYVALLERGINGLYRDRQPRREIMARFQAEIVKCQNDPNIWDVLYNVAKMPKGYYTLDGLMAAKYKFNFPIRHNGARIF